MDDSNPLAVRLAGQGVVATPEKAAPFTQNVKDAPPGNSAHPKVWPTRLDLYFPR